MDALPNMEISMDHMLRIVGVKELQLQVLKQRVMILEQQLKDARLADAIKKEAAGT